MIAPSGPARCRTPWLAALLALALCDGHAALSFDDARSLAVERSPMLAARRAAVDGAHVASTAAAELPDPKLTAGVDNFPIGGPMRYTISAEPMTQRSIGWMQ